MGTVRDRNRHPAATAVAAALLLALALPGASASASPSAARGSDPAAGTRSAAATSALSALPDSGPVRVVALSSGPGGRPLLDVEQAATPQAAATVIARMRADTTVTSIELDARVTSSSHPISTDPQRSQQWGMTRLRAEHAWAASTGTAVTVAVVDSGVDGSHPDLKGRLVPGRDYVVGYGDGSFDGQGHGTHVAGVVGAVPGNGLGVVGLAPGARVMSMRVLDATGAGFTSDVASAITDAVDAGADVVNLSLGGPDPSAAAQAAVGYALANDVPVVAAMGNERQQGSPTSYPAAYPGVIAVAATTTADVSAPYSNTGAHVTVSAPGSGIVSTYPGGYVTMSGTSMATPHVAAAVALLVEAKPGLTVDQVRAALTSTAQDLEAPGNDPSTGAGLVDPSAALTSLGAAPPPAPMLGLPRDWQGDGRADVLAADTSGRLHLYPGNGAGGFTTPRQIGNGWNGMDLLTQTGDWDGDRRPDLLARAADGALRLYAGDGRGGFSSSKQIGRGWGGMNALLSPSDWSGDGRVDLVARRSSDGALFLYEGDGRGGFAGSRQIGSRWGGLSLLAVAGDADSDGLPDLVGRGTDGALRLYPGNGRGGFGAVRVVATGWGAVGRVTGTGDWDGDGRPDLMAVAPDGVMRVHPGDGTGGYAAARVVGRGWSTYRLAV